MTWNGPHTGNDGYESHRCHEPKCPIINVQFDHEDETYHDVQVRYDSDQWNNVEVKDALHDDYELP